MRSVAIIGSFRRHNDPIQKACADLRAAGLRVTSPQGDVIVNHGDEFVRFRQDDINRTNAEIQLVALHRIFGADVTYVVAPGGYVGKTTCYEIGRLVQAQRPIYFSEHPEDLPVEIPPGLIMPLEEFISNIANPEWVLKWAFDSGDTACCVMERELIEGDLRNE